MKWIKTEDRLPTKKGNYEVKNNSSCNNGDGACYWDGEKWGIPDIIKNFYKVLAWQEREAES